MPGGAVHDQGQFAVVEQRKQDVSDVLRGQVCVVKDPHSRADLGFEGRVTRPVQRDLVVPCGFDLDQRQEQFG